MSLTPVYIQSDNTLKKANKYDAAFDLTYVGENVTLQPLERGLFMTNLQSVDLPVNSAGLIIPRSGMAVKHGVTVLNAPGLIDPGFKAPVRVVLVNISNEAYTVSSGDRIAQFMVVETNSNLLEEYEGYTSSIPERNGGFGSTGK